MEVIEVKGKSMLPTFKEGQKVLIVKKDKYNKGDIIVFRYYNNHTIIHRIIEVMEDGVYVCKGDNTQKMEYVLLKCIKGKVIRKM